MEVAGQNNNAPNATQRRDIATILLQAYKGFSGCCILRKILHVVQILPYFVFL